MLLRRLESRLGWADQLMAAKRPTFLLSLYKVAGDDGPQHTPLHLYAGRRQSCIWGNHSSFILIPSILILFAHMPTSLYFLSLVFPMNQVSWSSRALSDLSCDFPSLCVPPRSPLLFSSTTAYLTLPFPVYLCWC